MKKCIWCRKNEQEAEFKRIAHTVPKALGGKNICANVCDGCNHFFGLHFNGYPSIETIIKETFNISRARLLGPGGGVGKNKAMTKFSSIYFKVDLKKHKMDIKSAYKYQQGFQEKVGRQIKKGLYKMFLEEIERQKGQGHDVKYDFIREFARHDLGDYPVFYYERSAGIIPIIDKWVKSPELIMDEKLQMKYLVQVPGFFEFEFLGHVFGIATTREWELAVNDYFERTTKAKEKFFRGFRIVNYFNDIDLSLSIMDDVYRT